MRVSIQTPDFTPILLEISIESQDELNQLKKLFSHNVTVPALVYDNNSAMRLKLTELMVEILVKLFEVKL